MTTMLPLDTEIEKLRQENEKLKLILKQFLPEYANSFFIFGHSDETEEHGLPVTIEICPAYGRHGSATYRKISGYVET